MCFFFFWLQMILEQRNNQGMLRLVQPKSEGFVGDSYKSTEKVVKGPVESNCNQNSDREVQTETTDEKNAVVSKPGPMNASNHLAAEKTNPPISPTVGKLTYNPITHAPSMLHLSMLQ